MALSSARLGAPVWFVIAATIVPLALAQSIVNGLPQVRSLPPIQRNERFSIKNWACVVLFVLLVGLLMLPDPPSDDVHLPTLAESMNRTLPLTIEPRGLLDRIEWAPEGIKLFVRITSLLDRTPRDFDVVTRISNELTPEIT